MAEVFQSHPSSLLIILLCAMLLILMGSLQSCTPLAQSVLESLIIGTYPATEDDVRAAERAYTAKERELQDEMDRYEQYIPGMTNTMSMPTKSGTIPITEDLGFHLLTDFFSQARFCISLCCLPARAYLINTLQNAILFMSE